MSLECVSNLHRFCLQKMLGVKSEHYLPNIVIFLQLSVSEAVTNVKFNSKCIDFITLRQNAYIVSERYIPKI